MSRAATDRALWVALWAALWVVPACGSPDWPGGPVWQWFLSPKPHPGRHPASPVVVEVVDGTVVVVVGAVVVVVVGCVVDVVLLDVVVGGMVVVVVLDDVVLDVVVVGGMVVVVVLDVVVLLVVVVGAVVVVLLDVVVGMVVDVVELVDDEVDVVAVVTGIVMIVSAGMLQVATAVMMPFSFTVVVSCAAFNVTEPLAGATADTLMSGSVNVPGGNGPGSAILI